MSIEYFVEGKVTMQTDGDHISLSKGEISHNSTQNVNQKGAESGVSYNSPKEVHPNDKPINTIDVSLNLFFDGTQNNRTNTILGKDHRNSNNEDDSYTNDFSNVARGYDAVDPNVENQIRVYIEGIGTEDGRSESIIFTTKPNNRGIPFGMGERGVKAKVTKGCIQGAEALVYYAGKKFNLKVNVFGFSRGATAARYFLHIANSPGVKRKNFNEIVYTVFNTENEYILPPYEKYEEGESDRKVKRDHPLVLQHGYFAACLLEKNIIPDKITFNFVGLYDTVASYGVDHRGKKIGDISIIDDDTKQLGLDAVSKAYFTLQLAADDEHRDNFDLTNINSTGARGLQLTLPGVHSDIGGCYVHNSEEKVDLFSESEITTKCEKFKQILIDEGWYSEFQLSIVNSTPEFKRGPNKKNILVGTRKLYNTYDKIPLNTMFNYSKQDVFGVKYKDTELKDHEINDVCLKNIYNQLIMYMNACNNLRNTYIKEFNKTNNSGDYIEKINEISYLKYIDSNDLKILRNQYLHWSASVTKFGLGPKVGGVTNGKERKRLTQNG